MIGAYPPTGKYNLCRGSKAEHAKALVTIPKVPPPLSDPVFGADGPLLDVVARMTAGWLGFWDGAHSIYVNARHKDVHYRLIAQSSRLWCRSRGARARLRLG